MSVMERITLDENAYAFRTVQIIDGDTLDVGNCITHAENPYLFLRDALELMQDFGFIADVQPGSHYALIDVIDRHGDILQDFGVNLPGFRFLALLYHLGGRHA